jgi:hypothetical protein
MASSEFDIVGFAQKLGRLRRVARGEEVAGKHGLAIRTTAYEAGATLGSDPVADRAPSQPEPVSGHSDLHKEALCIVMVRMALAFDLVIDAFDEVLISTGPQELSATILSNLLESAKLPEAFCRAYRMPGILVCRRNYKRLSLGDRNFPSVGDGGQNEETH